MESEDVQKSDEINLCNRGLTATIAVFQHHDSCNSNIISATAVEPDGPRIGQVHQDLIDLKVEYAVLCVSFFMGKSPNHLSINLS
jgi:hypothetical protein